MSNKVNEMNIANEKIIQKIKDLIDKNNYDECLNYLNEIGSEEVLDKISWELVPVLVQHINEENSSKNLELFKTCENILEIIAEKCNPAETVLLFLEQIENFENDVRFCSLLKPLATSLSKANLSRVIEWFVSTIKAYSEGLPIPENHKNLAKQKLDPTVFRLTDTLNSLGPFLDQLIASVDVEIPKVRCYLIHMYLNLFGKPFSHLELNLNDPEKPCTFNILIKHLHRLTGDPMKFLNVINDRCNKRGKKFESDDNDDSDDINRLSTRLMHEITDLCYANFFYVLLSSDQSQNLIPQIYNPHYLMTSIFYLANYLLKQPEYILVWKGLSLIKKILRQIEVESIGYESLGLSVHTALFINLSQVMIYCDSESERKMALDVFRDYVKRFDMKSRYQLIIFLNEKIRHSGFVALVINVLKESVMQSLEREPHCDYFVGNKLEILMRKVCHLPHGSTSDLVEISDHVIAGLNLIRFLVIRDKTNDTGIWNFIKNIEADFLKPLREGVDMARAHWKVKIKDLEDQKKKRSSGKPTDDDISVTVAGENLPPMPIAEKIKFCYQALNALDIIESLVIRVNECIENNCSQCK